MFQQLPVFFVLVVPPCELIDIRLRERGYRQALFDAGMLMSPQYKVTAPALTELSLSLEYALDELMSLLMRCFATMTPRPWWH